MSKIHYRSQQVGDVNIFYREAGPADGPMRRGLSARRPGREVRFLDAGHFALETHHQEIAAIMREFLICTVLDQTKPSGVREEADMHADGNSDRRRPIKKRQ